MFDFFKLFLLLLMGRIFLSSTEFDLNNGDDETEEEEEEQKNGDGDGSGVNWSTTRRKTKVFLVAPNEYNKDEELNSCRFLLPDLYKTEEKTIKGQNVSNFKSKVLYIQGLFELNGSNREALGRSELASACLAIHHVNQRHFIPGYYLEMYVNNTKGDSGVAVDAFFHALYRKPQTLMLLGSAASQVTEQLAQIVSFWNLIQVSFGSTAPALSDRQSYPLFYRTVAPDSSHNEARVAFVQRFGWDTVSIISQNDDDFTLGINDLVQHLEHVNVSVVTTVIFSPQDYGDRLAQLKSTDCRIIFASFVQDLASDVLCEVYQLGMYGGEYVWIFHENLSKDWWHETSSSSRSRSRCSKTQVLNVLVGAFFIRSNNVIVGDQPSISNLTNKDFLEIFENLTLDYTEFTSQTYDAVWAIALTLKEAELAWKSSGSEIRLEDFNYKRSDMKDTFFNVMASLSFRGISGPVSFRGADRVGISSFYQNIDGELQPIALYFPHENNLDFGCFGCVPVYWKGGQIPVARRTLKVYIVAVKWTAFVAVTVLASFGILLAFTFLIFNLYYRKLKYIKLSSPKLNNMAVVGCILVYAAIILLGVDHRMISTEEHFPMLCMSRAFLLSAGFSLAFGSMFTKTYRVHQIFIRASSGVIKSKLLQDKRLIVLVGALLLIDCCVVTLWTVVDPMQRHLRNLTTEISHLERDIVYQPQVEECKSVHIEKWLGGLYVYKGLLLAVGVYMAWETRNVKIPALNDSQYIGLNVYNVVITSLIVVVIANLISEQKTLAFVVVTSLIFASTTTTLCLLFVPKLHAICKHSDGDPIVESMGLRIESNTRRFIIDEKREQYYRAEVQNRVYKRELAELNQQIGRLERLLNGESIDLNMSNTDGEDCQSFSKSDNSNNKGQGLEALCASTLNNFLYNRVLMRRRSCDTSQRLATKQQDDYASAIQSHIDHHRRQRKKRLKEYLPEIVVSSTSNEYNTEDVMQNQPLLNNWRLDADQICANHRQDLLRMQPWNCSKRMSLSVGPARVDASHTVKNVSQDANKRKRSLFVGFLSKAGSEGVLTASTGSSSLDGSSLPVVNAVSRPASQSLLMLDFTASLGTALSEDINSEFIQKEDAKLRDQIVNDAKGGTSNLSRTPPILPHCFCVANATARSSVFDSYTEIDSCKDNQQLSCSEHNNKYNEDESNSNSPEVNVTFSDDGSIDVSILSDMLDAKRKEIESLKSKLRKLEVDLKSLEENATSVFV